MYEIKISKPETGENKLIFGYSLSNAFRRAKLDSSEWEVLYMEYVD